MSQMTTTDEARVELAKARETTISLPIPSHIAIGDGGIVSGSPRTPAASETQLANEVLRKPVTNIGRVDNVNTFEITVDSTEANGVNISELALYTEGSSTTDSGTMVAIQTFTEKAKDSDTEITFQIEEEF